MKVVVSHPNSNQFNRSALQGFLEKDMLSEFHTGIALFPNGLLDRLASLPTFSEIRRRSFSPDLKNYTHYWPVLETGRLIAGKIGATFLTRHEKGVFCIDSVYNNLDQKTSLRLKDAKKRGTNGVYAYEDGALKTFREAKILGLNCFYDLPIGYWRTARELLEKEKDRWPEWTATLTGLKDSEEKLLRKDEELALADRIFVASSFTASTLKNYPGNLAPIEIIPYGFPSPISTRKYEGGNSIKPLKLLFVGGLSQRKGIADVFAVVDKLQTHVTLTVVGYKASDNCRVLDENLSRHRWIPSLPHSEILELMRNHDVLLFPSLFEGFGMVITEAMSQGTPVITTERTAGPDLIIHNENGWLIEAGSTIALEECLDYLLQNPQIISKVGKAARETAKQRPWKVYGEELATAISEHVGKINS
ncbi:glycosyltransferase family 4 protein [Salegentibacter sp. Hel_I_6]|uniref:glycosyltransferase family 4 protein n=1 Tax=Salegentibacter sp. Hel_I_6 TaxID=1250278 RepID=UPI00055C7BEA|nr:glycosyltransferase family 4 protein [Salegentibacter sp. Hel_I_6]